MATAKLSFVPGFEPWRLAFEQRLARVLREGADGPGRVGQAVRYAALSPGKRVRPLFVLATCEAASGNFSPASRPPSVDRRGGRPLRHDKRPGRRIPLRRRQSRTAGGPPRRLNRCP